MVACQQTMAKLQDIVYILLSHNRLYFYSSGLQHFRQKWNKLLTYEQPKCKNLEKDVLNLPYLSIWIY